MIRRYVSSLVLIVGSLLTIPATAQIPAAPGDVVITEIMNDPWCAPDPDGEWIELTNTTANPIDLTGWTIEDANGFPEDLTGIVIPPGGYVVLCRNIDSGSNGNVLCHAGFGFSLNNLTETLIVSDFLGEVVDQVVYDNTTFPSQEGASKSLDPAATNASDNDDGANWCEAVDDIGGCGDLGTPGAANPECWLPVCGDGLVDVSEGCDDGNVEPGDGCDAGCLVEDGWACRAGTEPSLCGSAGAAGGLVITEIMQNPACAGDTEGEWLEVYNVSGTTLELRGWALADAGTDFFIIEALSLPADAYAVLCSNADPATNGNLACDLEYTDFNLGNAVDNADLSDPADLLVDSVTWDDGATFPDPNGASMSLDPGATDATANDDGTNWCQAVDPIASDCVTADLGTPGAANPECWVPVCGDGLVDVSEGCDDGNVEPGDGCDPGCLVEDGWACRAGTEPSLCGSAGSAGDLVITEIMQNPACAGDTEGEWLEIYNLSGTALELRGWALSDAGTNFFVIEALSLPADAYAVLCSNADTATNGNIACDLEYSSFNLGNAVDNADLSDPVDLLVDSVTWDDGATFPDPNGASMSLDPEAANASDNDDGANWCQAVDPIPSDCATADLGTPGAANPECWVPVCGDGLVDVSEGCDDGNVEPGDGCDPGCLVEDGWACRAGTEPSLCGSAGVAGDVLVTEIMPNPGCVGDSAGEWLEIFNASGVDLELRGWILGDDENDAFLIEGFLLNAGGYAVLCSNADTAANGNVACDLEYSGYTLGNGLDEVVLTDPADVLVDRVAYDDGATFPDPTGASLSLDPEALDATGNDDGANWCEAITLIVGGCGDTGTPGQANPSCEAVCPDADADGFTDEACGGADCDDDDATIHPDADEVCEDGIDQDCDGSDSPCICPDADFDGFQDVACGGTDCDDADPDINPDVDETCDDGADNDCDGDVDVADDECAVACPDADQDGHQDADCGGDDCDDQDPGAYPGNEEICSDTIDNDCDGRLDRFDEDCAAERTGCSCGSPAGPGLGALLALALLFVLLRTSSKGTVKGTEPNT